MNTILLLISVEYMSSSYLRNILTFINYKVTIIVYFFFKYIYIKVMGRWLINTICVSCIQKFSWTTQLQYLLINSSQTICVIFYIKFKKEYRRFRSMEKKKKKILIFRTSYVCWNFYSPLVKSKITCFVSVATPYPPPFWKYWENRNCIFSFVWYPKVISSLII